MQISVAVTDANNIVCTVVPPQTQTITIDRGVAGNGIVSIVPVTISTFQYLRITYTNGTVSDVGPLTSTAYTATAPISIVGNTISLLTVPIASGGTAATTAAAAIQNLLPSYTGNGSKRLGLNSGATALEWIADGGGTVTSVALSGGTTGLTTSGGPITSSGTITLAGTLAIANGGSGQITAQLAMNAFAGAVTSGSYLRGNGTNVVMTTIQAADVPTLNQNTTGTAANVTGTVAIGNGGTGQTTAATAITALTGTQTSAYYLRSNGTNATLSALSAADLTGTVSIATGGTGQITANAAFNALAPSQTSQSGKYLTTDGTNTSWATNPLGTVTSVAATVPSFLSITGSPITTSGTLGITLSGTALPTTSGGTGLTSFTANGVVYASSTSALTTGSAFVFDGTNVGIGASSPTSILNVKAASPIFRLETTGTVSSGGVAYNAIRDSTGSDVFVNGFLGLANCYQFSTTAAAGFMRFLTGAQVEAMRIDSSGNVGIGTSSPAALLDINGSSGWVGGTTGLAANIKGANSTVTQGGNLRVLASTAFGVDIGGSVALGGQYTSGFYLDFAQIAGRKENATDNNTAGYLAFATRPNGGNTTERMRIDSAGNVGIGATANASAILDAQSTTKGVRMPNMTTTQKNAISSPAAGLMVFDTTLAKLCVYSGSAWQTVTSV